MNTKDYQVVRLSKLTAQRIKLFNKGNSYDENINAFLDYFDRTGANPWSLKEHPIEITMKGFDRTIAILKSIEKTKIDVSMKKLLDIESLLRPLADWVQKGVAEKEDYTKIDNQLVGEGEGQITEEELQTLVNLNQNLTAKVEELEEEIRQKNSEIYELTNSSSGQNSEEVSNIRQRISEISKRLEEGARKSSFGNDFSIKSTDLNFVVQSLKNISL
ncbi:BfmA/BtgA family mobilization protein [Sphingobacterium sp. JB170]|uniref:BfmA/BtgA family mobilization protein n=1 Tax=Sphingobacterium sp. JB170 TaxID=1434842 RepID=UPI00097EE92A|nr:BfmA/BtgA family mobilization protein [Sphingobacterium sp. JB170]SJN26961.1 hypothetical protein FM107_05150 [Sphingobacterium sp. JB170]